MWDKRAASESSSHDTSVLLVNKQVEAELCKLKLRQEEGCGRLDVFSSNVCQFASCQAAALFAVTMYGNIFNYCAQMCVSVRRVTVEKIARVNMCCDVFEVIEN